MNEKPPAVLPSLVSLVLCDQVVDDRLTSKKSAIGIFNTVIVQSVPTRIYQMAVIASLTEISGRTPLQLRLMRDADNETIFQTQGWVDAPNPLATVDLIFAMQGVQVPSFGQYAFELVAGGETLGRRRFHVHAPQTPPQASFEMGGTGIDPA